VLPRSDDAPLQDLNPSKSIRVATNLSDVSGRAARSWLIRSGVHTLCRHVAMSDRATATDFSPSQAREPTTPLPNAPSGRSHELNGATSRVRQRGAATPSTQPSSETSAAVSGQLTSSRTSANALPVEGVLTSEQHNGEAHKESPWARKTILSLGTWRDGDWLAVSDPLVQ
jgi:hypothetical protein